MSVICMCDLRILFMLFFFLMSFSSSEDTKSLSERNKHKKQNRFIPLSEGVTACVAHPLNGTIIAGTKVCGFRASTLLLFVYLILNMLFYYFLISLTGIP